jgi:hypothetical protein
MSNSHSQQQKGISALKNALSEAHSMEMLNEINKPRNGLSE